MTHPHHESANYQTTINQLAEAGLREVLSRYKLSLRIRPEHNLAYMFVEQCQRTPKDYIHSLKGLESFLKRVGDYDSLLSIHPQSPSECPSADLKFVSRYYAYRMHEKGTELKFSNGEAILDVVTKLPIRCLGDWKSFSCAEKLHAALRKQHESINQNGEYYEKCSACISLFNKGQTNGCIHHHLNPRLTNKGNIAKSSEMKKQRKWSQLYSIQTINHQIKSAYQMNPVQLEDVRRALVASGRKDDFMYFLMILLGGSLFLRGFEVCSIELSNVYVKFVEFEENCEFLVKRMVIGVKKKGHAGSLVNYELRRDDDYPKLCVIRHLLIYIHCSEIDMIVGMQSTPLFPSENKKSEFMNEKTLCRVLKRISREVLNIPDDVQCLTTHSLRNLGYVLATWGDGDRAVAISDAQHHIDADSFTRYTRDTMIAYARWKRDEGRDSAVNVLVPKWEPKKLYASTSVTMSGHNVLSLSRISLYFVRNILKVEGSNPSEKNPSFLLKRALEFRSGDSDMCRIKKFIKSHGSVEEQNDILDALFRERSRWKCMFSLPVIYIYIYIFFF